MMDKFHFPCTIPLPPGGTAWRNYTTADGLMDNCIDIITVDGNSVKWFTNGSGSIASYDDRAVSVGSDEAVPAVISLSNYPNPFNPRTTIEFALETDGFVKLDVFNLMGQKVSSLVNDNFPTGYHSVRWSGRDEQGQEISTGVYFLRLMMGDKSATHRMMLVK